ncbi:MAG: hypothetical protein H6619_04515 [Deltaproteobacteria bacterium]|nr:hypothetical protein [Deltaproteobacteria bacterium]
MQSFRHIMFALIASVVLVVGPAYATFCQDSIEPIVEVENNCDGTVTAHFGYINHNPSWCGDAQIQISEFYSEIDGIFPFLHFYSNWVTPEPMPSDFVYGQQPTTFHPGTNTHVFGLQMPADTNSPFGWQILYRRLYFNFESVTSDPLDAPATCPVVPEVTCMESVPGSTPSYKAHFLVTNYNTVPVNIPAGGDNKFTSIGDDQGQPTSFPAYPDTATFTLEWDGLATQWQLINPNCSNPEDCTTSAPSGSQQLDLNYFFEVTGTPPDEQFVHQCEGKPVNPRLNCTIENNDGTMTAWFGYHNKRPQDATIPVGTILNGGNEFASDGSVSVNFDQGQGSYFLAGRPQDGTVNVTWDPAVHGDNVNWLLFYGYDQINPFSVATAHPQCVPCATIEPFVRCIEQTTEGNQQGYLTAHFGYRNDNNFEIEIPVGNPNNYVDNGTGTPVSTFSPKGHGNAFTATFPDAGSVSWILNGEQASASMTRSRLCFENEPPTCSILGNTQAGCSGETTEVVLTGSGTDEEGRAVGYSWVVDCGTESYVVSGTDGEVLTLSLQQPGDGIEIASGNCTVTLETNDGFDGSSCSVEVTANACDLDCASNPIVGEPDVVVDQCGVCGGDNTQCADCAGFPNGTSVLDSVGGCCLTEQIDACGVCFGDGSSCADCAGTPNGVATFDQFSNCCLPSEIDACGLCGGNNDSCLGCTDISVQETQFMLDGGSQVLSSLAKRSGRKLKKKSKEVFGRVTKSIKKLYNNTVQEAEALLNTNWHLAWSTPPTVQSCNNTVLCVSVSNVSLQTQYIQNSELMKQLVENNVSKLREITNSSKIGKKLLKKASSVHEQNTTNALAYPSETSVCN